MRMGRVEGQEVKTLRDSGCNGVVVKRDLVKNDQYTGDYGYMILIE